MVLSTWCRLHLPCLWALGLACGAPCFPDADRPLWQGQAVFSPSSVSSQAGWEFTREEENLGYIIKLHPWHGDLV